MESMETAHCRHTLGSLLTLLLALLVFGLPLLAGGTDSVWFAVWNSHWLSACVPASAALVVLALVWQELPL